MESYVQNFSLSVQQELPEKFVGTVSYVGAKGTHLFRRSYTNLINPATGTRPLAPYYATQIDTKFMEGGSVFHALQVNVARNMDHGLFFAINYMWSHAINDGSVGAGEGDWPEIWMNLCADRSPAKQLDTRQCMFHAAKSDHQ
jgi:hypothetical protein